MIGSIKNIFLWSICIVLYISKPGDLHAQSRSQLEDERNNIIKQIEETTSNLETTTTSKKATLKDLKAIENQIKNRRSLIKNIQNQLKAADNTIKDNNNKIDSLNTDLINIDKQYKSLVRQMYLKEKGGNKWAYIFSSSTINAAFLKWRYTKQFEAFVDRKVQKSSLLKGNISNQNSSIEEEKNYINTLLDDEKKNEGKLKEDLKKKDVILNKLKKEESSLKKDLKRKKSQREKLNKEIEKIILAELARKNAAGNTSTSSSIAKKKLAWPGNGYISGKFGKQPHPTIKNVTINNNGIDITCKKSAPVSVVADGTVISITTIPGYDNMIIVQHGNYYSVYSKLKHVIVQKNDNLQAGQTIGRLSNENAPVLHFELWKEKDKLNPVDWLK